MPYNSFDFVNRTTEIDLFAGLLRDRRRRILLMQGVAGIGKTTLLQRLRTDLGDPDSPDIASTVVDFYTEGLPLEIDQVIAALRVTVGGVFADHMQKVEAEIERDFAGASTVAPAGQAGMVEAAQALSAALPAATGGSSSVLALGEGVTVGGDVVQGYKVTINQVIQDPAAGRALLRDEVQRRRDTGLREALRRCTAERRLVLFFDHFEKSGQAVRTWMRQQVLWLHLEDGGLFPNLWIVITGRVVPLQEEVDRWRDVLRATAIGPLSDDAIALFWVTKRGLDPASLPVIIKGTRGNPQLLSAFASNTEEGSLGNAT